MPSKRKRLTTTSELVQGTASEVAIVSTTQVISTEEVRVDQSLPTPSRRSSTRLKNKQHISVKADTGVSVSVDADGGVKDSLRGDSPLMDLEHLGEETTQEVKPPKRKRRKKNDEPVVYDIPPVETKTTTFKGRLGYACLNTILRAAKPDPIFCSRTCRLDTIRKQGIEFAQNLGKQNARDLCKLIEWNEENGIKFLRVSSEMFPFASHAEVGYGLEYAKEELKAAGDLAKRLGHRLTTHPGQFTQLASPRDAVVTASVRELEYHCEMMRHMGLDQDGVIIIHMGGVYGDKAATLARFKENYQAKLTDEMRARLVLENDEMCYNVDDLLPVCNELNIPLVFDYHHDWIYPSVSPPSTLIPLINATWHRKGIKPKQHLSSPRPGAETVMEKRAHADRCTELPEELPTDMDLMIEAKDKEQAVLYLYRIYELHPVIHANLRPEKPPKPFVRSSTTTRNKVDVASQESGLKVEGGEGEDNGEVVDEEEELGKLGRNMKKSVRNEKGSRTRKRTTKRTRDVSRGSAEPDEEEV